MRSTIKLSAMSVRVVRLLGYLTITRFTAEVKVKQPHCVEIGINREANEPADADS